MKCAKCLGKMRPLLMPLYKGFRCPRCGFVTLKLKKKELPK